MTSLQLPEATRPPARAGVPAVPGYGAGTELEDGARPLEREPPGEGAEGPA
ncbi:hypothetical protein ACFZCP_27020 [Streptomyces sp. NPDC007971]|uniref:hypothetical protein n=1 Tax=Streptomyces sp. NPDC007971 TaxID=3364799 RepID=UPI0036E43959